MSVMQLVREKYKTAIGRTDKTDTSTFVSNGSPSYEELIKQFPDLEEPEVPNVVEMLHIQRMRSRGIAPHHYTAQTQCKHCGPVPIWDGCPPDVDGCPWCFNRHKGLPIPKAVASQCIDDTDGRIDTVVTQLAQEPEFFDRQLNETNLDQNS